MKNFLLREQNNSYPDIIHSFAIQPLTHTMQPNCALNNETIAQVLTAFREKRPLVHCLTNEVVQEITANVLLAAGASPAMVVAREEAKHFATIAGALLVNVGTPYQDRLTAMHEAIAGAQESQKPWVLDPVAAGVIPWRDSVILDLLKRKPTVVRGNASEIMALAGHGSGGKGVDSTDSSENALRSAQLLAKEYQCIVCVTGETDYVTDSLRTLSTSGGHIMTTLVVGTGCSLSALVAAFCAAWPDPLEASAVACAIAKKASSIAIQNSTGPGSFHTAYLDALYTLSPEHFKASNE